MPRHEFVFHEYTEQAYADGPLTIGEDQVIMQLSLVARMTQALHLQESEMHIRPAWSTEMRGMIRTTVSKTQHGLDLVKALDFRLSIEKNMCQNSCQSCTRGML
jgi:Protein-L-isoaspartate(D-aspartate) O-methyltransferase (PCMT)